MEQNSLSSFHSNQDQFHENKFEHAILGYRYWSITPVWEFLTIDSGQEPLGSITGNGGDWEPGINKSVCNKYSGIGAAERDWNSLFPIFTPIEHESPGENCHCGFNAYHTIKSLRNSNYTPEAVGTIAGSGQVQIHSSGFRVEQAAVLALLDIGDSKQYSYEISQIAHYYNVPVFKTEVELTEYSVQYAQPAPNAWTEISEISEIS